jgi:hypothetical protein
MDGGEVSWGAGNSLRAEFYAEVIFSNAQQTV